MILKLMTIYDAKSEVYDRPWLAKTRGEAVRSFTEAASDPKTLIHKYPSDFSLIEIGEWDDTKGVALMAKAHHNLGNGVDFIKKDVPLNRGLNDE